MSAVSPWHVAAPIALHLVLLAGLYQVGYTPSAWQEIRVEAQARGVSRLAIARERDGLAGYVRAYYMTDSDERLYREYADLAITGRVDLAYLESKKHVPNKAVPARPWPYRDVQIEYPPGAMLAIVPPGLLSLEYTAYRFWLGVWLTMFHLVNLWLAWRLFSPERDTRTLAHLAWASLLFLFLLGNIAVTRIDPVVATCMLAALGAFSRSLRRANHTDRWALVAGAAAGFGLMVKIVPALVLPALLVGYLGADRHRRLQNAMACAAGFAAFAGAATAASLFAFGPGYLDTFAYHAARGLSLDSVAGSALMAFGAAGGAVTLARGFGSVNVVSSLADTLAHVSPLVVLGLGATTLVVAWRSCRREAPWSTDTAVHAAGLTTLGLLIAFVLGNKVFAPQYLMWIAPLALGIAVARQPVAWSVPVLLLLAAASTQVFYPRGFAALQHVHPVPVAALNIRNALVAAIWAITLARPVSILRAPTAAGR